MDHTNESELERNDTNEQDVGEETPRIIWP